MPEGIWSGKEQMKSRYRYILLSGIAIWGILMAMAVFYSDYRNSLLPFYDVMHIPAEYFGDFWVNLRIPPRGESGFLIIAPITVGLQWLIVFAVVFFITRKKHKNGRISDKAND